MRSKPTRYSPPPPNAADRYPEPDGPSDYDVHYPQNFNSENSTVEEESVVEKPVSPERQKLIDYIEERAYDEIDEETPPPLPRTIYTRDTYLNTTRYLAMDFRYEDAAAAAAAKAAAAEFALLRSPIAELLLAMDKYDDPVFYHDKPNPWCDFVYARGTRDDEDSEDEYTNYFNPPRARLR